MPVILLVEDDEDTAEIVIMYLRNAGYDVHWMADGQGVVEWVESQSPALILLDIDLPKKSGTEICKEVRAFSDVPIIMTTAKVEEVDRLLGLELGADDYVCKPYSVKEVVARTKANLRRWLKVPPTDIGPKANDHNYTISYGEDEISLTPVEFALFKLLSSNPNRIYNRAQILDLAYNEFRDISDRTIDSHVRNVRKKIAMLPLPTEHDFIRTVYGAGYKYEPMP